MKNLSSTSKISNGVRNKFLNGANGVKNIFRFNISFPIIRVFPLKFKFNLKLFAVSFILIIISLISLYFFQFNYLTFANSQIKNSQETIKKLSIENENLEVQLAKNNSLSSIEDLIKNLDFVKVEKIHYIQILENQIVKE